MNVRLSNQISMIGTCATVAYKEKNYSVWNGNDPIRFTTGMTRLKELYPLLTQKASDADAGGSGAADAKAVVESGLEDAAYVLARAICVHLKDAGDLERRAPVDLSRSEIVRLRNNDLVAKAIVIRDLGATVATEPKAHESGVTAERVDGLTKLIVSFKGLIAAPRGQIVSRATLLKELETDVAAALDLLNDMDDLVPQFNGTPDGKTFVEAWHGARMIIDRVGEWSPKPAPSPTPTSAPASKL